MTERDALRAHADRLAAALRHVVESGGTIGEMELNEARTLIAATPADSGAEWAAMEKVCEAAAVVHREWQERDNYLAADMAELRRALDALARLEAVGLVQP